LSAVGDSLSKHCTWSELHSTCSDRTGCSLGLVVEKPRSVHSEVQNTALCGTVVAAQIAAISTKIKKMCICQINSIFHFVWTQIRNSKIQTKETTNIILWYSAKHISISWTI